MVKNYNSAWIILGIVGIVIFFGYIVTVVVSYYLGYIFQQQVNQAASSLFPAIIESRKAFSAFDNAQKCQSITDMHQGEIADFDHAFAQEGLARVFALEGNLEKAEMHHNEQPY